MASYNFNDSPTANNSMSPQQTVSDNSHATPRNPNNVTVYQTTGPDAYSSPIEAPGGSGQPALNPRSCVTCRRRKVRCDKQMPCSNCRRALIPCVFPAPGRAPRQPRNKDTGAPPKTSSQREVELLKRLRKLEGIVEELSGQVEVESTGGKGPSSANSPDTPTIRKTSSAAHGYGERPTTGSAGPSPMDGDSYSDHSSDIARRKDVQNQLGRLVLNDHKGSTRYVSNAFWSKLNDELAALREDTQKLTDDDTDLSDYDESPETTPSGSAEVVDDHHAFILGYRSCDVDVRSCHPAPPHILYLWTVYQDNVEPLIKILHVPTIDLVFRELRKDPTSLSPAMEALVFTIYYAAVVSLEDDEVQSNLGRKREDICRQFRFALEQCLSKANFLNTSEFTVLQAFTLFIIVVRRFDDSRFCWTLTGLIIRIGQGMGLHRDGTNFEMTPYETEMRRRLWWAILTLDLRSAEELGTDLTVLESSFDTQMPANINDADISPTSTVAPPEREGRTDCAVSIVRHEILVLLRRFIEVNDKESMPGDLEEKEKALMNVYQRIENRFLRRVVDENDALYWMVALVSRIIMSKLCLTIYQPNMFAGPNSDSCSDEIRQRCYIAAIEIVEIGQRLNSDPRCKQYRWLYMTYTNWHAIAYNLVETCRRPWTPLAERSWEAVCSFDRAPVEIEKSADHAAVFLPMRKMYLKARKHREAEITRLRTDIDEARKLEFKERTGTLEAKFGPTPGYERRMDEVRAKWWRLIRPEGGVPGLNSQNMMMGSSSSSGGTVQTPTPTAEMLLPQQKKPFTPTTSGPNVGQFNLSEAAMDYMDDFMSNPNTVMTSLWSLHDEHFDRTQAAGVPMSAATPMQEYPAMADGMRYQQPMPIPNPAPKDDNLPPYLWPGAFGGPEDGKVDTSGDMDMLSGDFDWQDWTQSLQNLHQPPQGRF